MHMVKVKCLYTILLIIHQFNCKEIYSSKNELIIKTNNEFQTLLSNCTMINCPAPEAYCINSHVCECNHNYANINQVSICSYKKKYQMIAFLLELIFSFGIGHIYCKRIKYAMIKISIEILLIIVYCLSKYSGDEIKFYKDNVTNIITSIFNVLVTVIFMGLHIYDIIMFAKNNFNDGFNIPLIPWNMLFK